MFKNTDFTLEGSLKTRTLTLIHYLRTNPTGNLNHAVKSSIPVRQLYIIFPILYNFNLD